MTDSTGRKRGRSFLEANNNDTPAVPPDDWERCHFYLPAKRRFCHQAPQPSALYCIHHQEMSISRNNSAMVQKRIPCPLDPSSHTIDPRKLQSHLRKCPAVKKRKALESKPYYQANVNCGGESHGNQQDVLSNCPPVPSEKDTTDRARTLLQALLRIHHRNRIGTWKVDDRSSREYQKGFLEAISQYRIKTKPRHTQQYASLLGHVFQNITSHPATIVEMGAGRGILGVLVASRMKAIHHQTPMQQLYLIDRASHIRGIRYLRTAHQYHQAATTSSTTFYMDPTQVRYKSIECDLKHIDLSNVLQKELQEKQPLVIVAKHLCGAGTDYALKSIVNTLTTDETSEVVLVMATCCHGLCRWEDYVGRQFWMDEMKLENVHDFSANDFDSFIRKWSCAMVSNIPVRTEEDEQCSAEEDDHHTVSVDARASTTMTPTESACEHPGAVLPGSVKLSDLLKDQNLSSKPAEIGRICQELIDFGRQQYLQQSVKLNYPPSVELLHYVPSTVTPQNTALVMRTTH